MLYAYALSSHHQRGNYLLYELAEKGSLDAFWNSELGRERLASFARRAQIALDIFIGLQFLHIGNSTVKPSFHCDVKSANIVLKRDMTAQLIDCGMGGFSQEANNDAFTSAGVRGTLGYICPKYCTGFISFDASCDIFSFGIVLAELWSGRLQNHCDESGRVHNFYDDYIDSDEPRSMQDDLDKALGYDETEEIPACMKQFKDLSLACVSSNPQKRPSGNDVLNRLEKSWQTCQQNESQATTQDDDYLDSVQGSLQLVPDAADDSVCRICRTYAVEVGFQECQLCLALQQQRVAIAEAVPIELDANYTAPAIEQFTSMRSMSSYVSQPQQQQSDDSLLPIRDLRLNHSIPRLFVMIPAHRSDNELLSPGWLQASVPTRFHLFFICQDTLEAVSPPIQLIASKVWLQQIVLLLGVSLTLLQQHNHPNKSLHFMGNELINQQELEVMFKDVEHMLQDTGELDILSRVRSGFQLSDQDVRVLNGNAYEMLAEKARQDLGWRRAIQPVRKLFDIEISWVATSVAEDLENKYEVIEV